MIHEVTTKRALASNKRYTIYGGSNETIHLMNNGLPINFEAKFLRLIYK